MSRLKPRELNEEGIGGVVRVRDDSREINVDLLAGKNAVDNVLTHRGEVGTTSEGKLHISTTTARDGSGSAHATVTEAIVDGGLSPVACSENVSE